MTLDFRSKEACLKPEHYLVTWLRYITSYLWILVSSDERVEVERRTSLLFSRKYMWVYTTQMSSTNFRLLVFNWGLKTWGYSGTMY